jgi:hypothetical protein
MRAVPALRYNKDRGIRHDKSINEAQLMVRKKGGSNMNSSQRRIVIVPKWKREPDLTLIALAIIEIARQMSDEAISEVSGG